MDLQKIARQLQGVLIGARARVDAMRRVLEAFVQRWIKENAPQSLDRREGHLPAARHVAAEQEPHPLGAHQPLGGRPIIGGHGLEICDDGLDRAVQHAAGGVDLLDRQETRLEGGLLDARRHAGLRKQQTDTPRFHGHRHYLDRMSTHKACHIDSSCRGASCGGATLNSLSPMARLPASRSYGPRSYCARPERAVFVTRSRRGLSPKRSLNRRERWPALEKPVAKAISLTRSALC